MPGPLSGVRIIELASIGPAPFAAMMLADHGAEVIRVERPGVAPSAVDPLLRSRRSVVLDLKQAADVAQLRALCRTADGLIEGFRPGVMERLGLGPDALHAENPALIYGRMTGWGQDGPYAAMAGHDINFISTSGVLAACGRAGDKPVPPLNFAGDLGGGAMMLAFGMVSALLAARASGRGQVVDCAMSDGSALLMAPLWGLLAEGSWRETRGVNLLDSGAPFYDAYETADGGCIAVGAVEPQFYALLRERLGLAEAAEFDAQDDCSVWPHQKRRLADLFRTKTRAEWCAIFEGVEACFTPVLAMSECPDDPHNAARGTFIAVDGVIQPAPAPRYSETPCAPPRAPRAAGADQAMLDALAVPAAPAA